MGYRPARYARQLRGAGAVFDEMSGVTLGPHFLRYFFALFRKLAKTEHSGPPFGAPFGNFCTNSCVFELGFKK